MSRHLDASDRRLRALLPLARKLADLCSGAIDCTTAEAISAIQDLTSDLHAGTERIEHDEARHDQNYCDPEVCDWCRDGASYFDGPEPSLSAAELNGGWSS